jgi:hypothetical protein
MIGVGQMVSGAEELTEIGGSGSRIMDREEGTDVGSRAVAARLCCAVDAGCVVAACLAVVQSAVPGPRP